MNRLRLGFWIAMLITLGLPASAQVTVVGSKYAPQQGVQVAPGQVVTVLLTGLKTVFPANASVQRATTVPLPTQLAGISAAVQQTGTSSRPLPLLAVQQIDQCALTDNGSPTPDCLVTALSVQIPSDLIVPNPLAESPVAVVSQLTITENGTTSRSFYLTPVMQNVHIVNTCDLISGNNSGSCAPIIAHTNGNLVSTSNPAVAGEVLVLYALGLGATSPPVPEGQASPNPPASIVNSVGLGFNYANPISLIESPPTSGAATPVPEILFAGFAPTMVGIYQVNFRVPPPTTAASSCATGGVPNLTMTLQGLAGSSDQAILCVDIAASSSSATSSTPAAAASSTAGIPTGAFIPQTVWFPIGANLTGLAQPLPPGTSGVPGPNHE